MSKRHVVIGMVVLLVAGTAVGVAGGIIDGQWTAAAVGFTWLAGLDTMRTHQQTHPGATRPRRAVSLVLLALAVCRLAAAAIAAANTPAGRRTTSSGAGLVIISEGLIPWE